MKQAERIFQKRDKRNERILILCIVLGCVTAPGIAAAVLLQMMRASDYLAMHTAPDQMLLVVFPLMMAVTSLARLLRRRKYKQRMDAYGVGEADFAHFDRDMQGEVFKCSWHTIITNNFLFGKTPAHTYLFPLRDVVFVYQHVTGMSRIFYLCFCDGQLQTIPASEANAPALQRFLTDRCPNLVEFSEKERRDLWVKGRREIHRQARLRTAQYQGKQ